MAVLFLGVDKALGVTPPVTERVFTFLLGRNIIKKTRGPKRQMRTARALICTVKAMTAVWLITSDAK
uniref:Uncharacterized protein n=1 Tax=Amphimedon queenslandica TaxID=400682 RepID=A0A1X7SEX3_AMPQE